MTKMQVCVYIRMVKECKLNEIITLNGKEEITVAKRTNTFNSL